MATPVDPIKTFTRLLLVVMVLIGPPLWWLHHTLSSGEIRSKAEWASLQSIESNLRGEPDQTTLLFRQHHGYHLVGIPHLKTQSRVWVLLNPQAEPFFKQLPSGVNFHLSQQQLDQILASEKVHPQVREELEKHLIPEPPSVPPPASTLAPLTYPMQPSCS